MLTDCYPSHGTKICYFKSQTVSGVSLHLNVNIQNKDSPILIENFYGGNRDFQYGLVAMHPKLSIFKMTSAPKGQMHRLATQQHALSGPTMNFLARPIKHQLPPSLCITHPPPHQSPLIITRAQAPPVNRSQQQKPSSNNNKNRRKSKNINPPSKSSSSAIEDDLWQKLISRLTKAAALLAIAAAIALGGARPAEAARSGGRMGGSSFGAARSYGGSYGSSFGSARSFGSSSSSSSSTLTSSLFGGGMGSTFGPSYRSSMSTNAFFFSPFGMGYGYGMGGGGGMNFASLLFWGVFAVIMVQTVRGVLGQGSSSSSSSSSGALSGRNDSNGGERLSVAKVQVGLLSSARELQKDLEGIASRADTSSSRGLHYVLQETVLALMRNPDYCVYGFAKSGVEDSVDQAESRFNKLSLEERGKFQKETRVNVSGRTSRGSLGGANSKDDLRAPVTELLVVTVLVAVEGRLRLPKVKGRLELVEALTSLGAVPAADVMAVEVLWTPEEEDDYFTQEDMSKDYPLLITL